MVLFFLIKSVYNVNNWFIFISFKIVIKVAPTIIHWKVHLFFADLRCHFYWILNFHMLLDLFLYFLFCSSGLSIHTFLRTFNIVIMEIVKILSFFFFNANCLDIMLLQFLILMSSVVWKGNLCICIHWIKSLCLGNSININRIIYFLKSVVI